MQLAVEVVRHVVAEVVVAGLQVDQAGPVGHRRLALALERVEVSTEQVLAVTPGSRGVEQAAELGQQQVEDLAGLHFQGAFLEELRQRVRRPVARDLQDAFVDGVDHGAAWAVGADPDVQRLARLYMLCRADLQRDAPRVQLDAQRRHAVGQRAHVHLRRSAVADELHVDVGVALQSGGQADALHAAGAVGLEPLVGIDLVALDGDQAGAGVGRADADLDLVALGIGVLVQAQLQLGVALQRATGVAVAGDAVVDLVQRRAVGSLEGQGEVAGLAGVQSQLGTAGGNVQRLAAQRDVLDPRLVLVGTVGLLDQHRHVAVLDQLGGQAVHRQWLEVGADGQPLDFALGALAHVVQRINALDPSQPGCGRHHQAALGGDVAPALGLEHPGQQAQAIGAGGVAVQAQVERRFAVVVGLALGQFLGAAVAERVGDAESVVGVLLEGGVGRRQGHLGGDPTAGGRRAEQVHGLDLGLDLFGGDPALHRCLGQGGADLHAVRLEVAHLEVDITQRGAPLVFVDQAQGRGVGAGRRCLAAMEVEALEATGGELQLLAQHALPARVAYVQFHRQTLQLAAPVGGAHDHAEVRGLARAIQAAVAEQVGAEAVRLAVLVLAADIEARQVEAVLAVRDRQEGLVVAVIDHVHQRGLLAAQLVELGEVRLAAAVGIGAGHRQAIATEDLHLGAGYRAALADRLDEQVVAAVAAAFGDDAEVGDHHEAQVAGRVVVVVVIEGVLARVILGAELDHEDAAAAAFGIQVGRQVDVAVLGLRGIAGVQ